MQAVMRLSAHLAAEGLQSRWPSSELRVWGGDLRRAGPHGYALHCISRPVKKSRRLAWNGGRFVVS